MADNMPCFVLIVNHQQKGQNIPFVPLLISIWASSHFEDNIDCLFVRKEKNLLNSIGIDCKMKY